MRPVCGGCKTWMRAAQHGVFVQSNDELRQADEYRCPQCGQVVITDFAKNPLATTREGVAEWVEKIKAQRPESLRVISAAAAGASTGPRR